MARETLIAAVRHALAGAVVPSLPPVAPAAAGPEGAALAARFAREARAVGTIVHEVDGPAAAIATVAAIVRDAAGSPRIVAWSTPLAQAVAAAAVAAVPAATLHVDAAPPEVAAADVGITEADYLVADSGTLLLRAAGRGRGVSLLPPVHVAVVPRARLVGDLGAALAALWASGARDSCITLVTGPSRTADIEKKLVVGVHGPCTLHVVLLERAEA